MYLHGGKIIFLYFTDWQELNTVTSLKLSGKKGEPAYQLWTNRTDGVLNKLSGSKLISFMMLASLTGNSCLRKLKDVFTHAFSEPERETKGTFFNNFAWKMGNRWSKLLNMCKDTYKYKYTRQKMYWETGILGTVGHLVLELKKPLQCEVKRLQDTYRSPVTFFPSSLNYHEQDDWEPTKTSTADSF